MKLKTKLTLGISLLVLLVVLAVNLVYLAGVVRQETAQVYDNADFLAHEIYNEMSQELAAAQAANQLQPGAAGLNAFFQNLSNSPALATLLNSVNGYSGVIREVSLVGPDGVVVVDSNPSLEGHPQPQRRQLSNVIRGGLGRQVGAIFGPEEIYNLSLATEIGSQPFGTVNVGVDTVLLRQAMIGRIQQLALYGALIVLLATGLAWGLSDVLLRPLAAISAQLDRLTAAAPANRRPAPDFGAVSSKIERLGQEMADVRQVYTTLQENVAHVLESLDEGLLLFDANGQCVLASAAMPRLLGLEAGELKGQPVEFLFPGTSALDQAVCRAVREKTALAPATLERQAGGTGLLARLDPIGDGGGRTGALLTLRDPEPLLRLENELEVARRLSAVGRLTRGVAHEVKNPLNAMAIHLDLLREKAGPEATRLLPHVQVIRHEIERLDRVVRTFLDFSRPVEPRLEAGDLGELVRSVAQLVEADASAKGMRIVTQVAAAGPRAWFDRDLMEQALLNLMNNGMQAMAATDPPGEELRLEAFEQDQTAVIRVRDQGPGIPAEHRDNIFDLYFTTRNEGAGIGLSLAARIMQLHHGAIELEASEAGAGASFLLRFPRRRWAPVTAAVAEEARA